MNQDESTLQHINLEIQTGVYRIVKIRMWKKYVVKSCVLSFDLSSGRILMDGKEVNGPGAERTVMFQEHALYPWLTVRENVEFGMKLSRVSKETRLENRIIENGTSSWLVKITIH